MRINLTSTILLLIALFPRAQAADFQIVWVVVGDAASSAGDQPAQAGRHLFMASDLADFALKRVAISRVETDPAVIALNVGERFCLTSLKIIASQQDRSIVKRAPLSVSVRQDQRDAMGLERRKNDICVHPDTAGEYPIRFTSLLPANDGSTRGAQIFVRVQAPVMPGDSERANDAGSAARNPEKAEPVARTVADRKKVRIQ
ncbi:hypothetical protein HNQ60_002020 [Povalibacter uvarum]|uniref:DUF2259 domain-containing protein n=1 Tax=Povalibacter uvarum TaxID=732238 RepID=A0A841HM22_9GAMM|nr:hypothetical protein [Povalibacter uvarum]MBB6093142.1 hypothetical protein [Povalibacter uvarum]